MQGFAPFVLNLSKSGNTLFGSMPNGNGLFSSASLVIGTRKLTGAHEFIVMAAVENATYYAQHPTLRSVYRKKQSVVGRKLFSSYRTVFALAHGL